MHGRHDPPPWDSNLLHQGKANCPMSFHASDKDGVNSAPLDMGRLDQAASVQGLWPQPDSRGMWAHKGNDSSKGRLGNQARKNLPKPKTQFVRSTSISGGMAQRERCPICINPHLGRLSDQVRRKKGASPWWAGWATQASQAGWPPSRLG
jgi:hypothetical protein